jgi:hypothetical protein
VPTKGCLGQGFSFWENCKNKKVPLFFVIVDHLFLDNFFYIYINIYSQPPISAPPLGMSESVHLGRVCI